MRNVNIEESTKTKTWGNAFILTMRNVNNRKILVVRKVGNLLS